MLVGCRLADLPDGARIGTGAPRRALQLLDWAARHGPTARGRAGPRQRGHPDRAGPRRSGWTRWCWPPPGCAGSVISDRSVGFGQRGHRCQRAARRGPDDGRDAAGPRPGGPGARGSTFARRTGPGRGRPASTTRSRTRRPSPSGRSWRRWRRGARHRWVRVRVVKSVRGTSLDLTLRAVIGRTLLSNLSEPTKTGASGSHATSAGRRTTRRSSGRTWRRSVLDQLSRRVTPGATTPRRGCTTDAREAT